jgi:hypothetical protein
MTKEEKQWLDDITGLGCIVCRNSGFGPSLAEVHHLRCGVGIAQRSKHLRSIPLCPEHHRNGGYGIAFHAGPKVWQESYGHELELLEQVVGEVDELRKGIIGRVV